MVIFFGPAGSGKSTQGEIIAEKYGCVWLSVGALLRERAVSDPEMAKTLEQGILIDNETVVKIMSDAIAATDGKMVILDGYPRDVWQAEWLLKNGTLGAIEGAIVLDGGREELKERLLLRARDDDNDEAIVRRFAKFDEMMGRILPVLRDGGVKVVSIDCIGTVEQVTKRIERQLTLWGID